MPAGTSSFSKRIEAVRESDLKVTITGFDSAEIDLLVNSNDEAAPERRRPSSCWYQRFPCEEARRDSADVFGRHNSVLVSANFDHGGPKKTSAASVPQHRKYADFGSGIVNALS
jgi:hypothetical protein